ncbi:MAG TPA: SDR family oxidoreductase [Candidatus Saccharimonadales bacterium]|nr:SDR family oxidoreductase [Candidatus Saccharimonadales bacterium]
MSSAETVNFNFENKNAFVTGASKGLGEQIGLKLLERGVHVIGASRTGPPESFQPYIEQGQADYELGDLAREGDRVISDIYEKHQGYEIFVNNAGAFSPDYFTHLDPDKIRGDLELDLITPLLLHRSWFGLYDKFHPNAKAPELSINICSISSFYAWPGGTAYQAAKTGLGAAIYGLRSMQAYLNEQAPDEVKSQIGPSASLATRIIAIYPDNVATGLISRAQAESLYEVQGEALPPDIVVQTVMQAIDGQGKFSEYDDVAILVNPNEPGSEKKLRGVYLGFIPIDDETHRPNFASRTLEKIADEDILVKRGAS